LEAKEEEMFANIRRRRQKKERKRRSGEGEIVFVL
jgi:hypothetical protein